MSKKPKSRPKIKHHVCTPFPFKAKTQAYFRCRICGRAMEHLPAKSDIVATPETKRICDEILHIFIESERQGKIIVYKR